MAEDLGKKLEDVLAKLGKLDIIESRLNEVFTSLSNIEQSINRLENDVKTLKVKTKRLDESFKELDESVNFNEENISYLKRDTKAINFEVKEIEKQMLYMETYSRRENIKFIGIDEDFVTSQSDAASNRHQQQGENTKEIVYNFMEKELKIKNPRDKIEFTTIFKGERFLKNFVLDVCTHFKLTETFQYTHFTSCHVPGVPQREYINDVSFTPEWFVLLLMIISVSTTDIKIFAKATAILVPIAVP